MSAEALRASDHAAPLHSPLLLSVHACMKESLTVGFYLISSHFSLSHNQLQSDKGTSTPDLSIC